MDKRIVSNVDIKDMMADMLMDYLRLLRDHGFITIDTQQQAETIVMDDMYKDEKIEESLK